MQRERLHGEFTRSGARGGDRQPLDLLDRFYEGPRVSRHLADRDGADTGAANNARNLDDRLVVEERQAAPVRRVEDQHAPLVERDRLDNRERLALIAARLLV